MEANKVNKNKRSYSKETIDKLAEEVFEKIEPKPAPKKRAPKKKKITTE